MAVRLSRRKLAEYAAAQLLAGKTSKAVMKELAGYLVEAGRTREAELLARDIEAALAEQGVVVVDVTTARPLSSEARQSVKTLVGGKNVQLRESLDPTLLGGVRIDTPGKQFDASLRRKLTALKATII